MKPKIISLVKIILKLAFALGIIYFLVSKGKLDFALLGLAWKEKMAWAICALLVVIQIIIGTYRWKQLVQIKSDKPLPLFQILIINWVGLFFSSVLPGAVSGDFIKLIYARGLDKKLDKTFLLTSILMDRVIGLMGLLFLLGIFSLISYKEIIAQAPPMQNLFYFNFLLFFGVLLLLAALFLPEKYQIIFLKFAEKIPVLGKQIQKTLFQIWLIGKEKRKILLCLALSMLAHFCGILAFWKLTAPFYTHSIPLAFAFTFMPIGMMAMAIPLTPAGLGVGHAIFGTLFSYFGEGNGASLFNLYFVTYLCINLLGAIPYLLGPWALFKQPFSIEIETPETLK